MQHNRYINFECSAFSSDVAGEDGCNGTNGWAVVYGRQARTLQPCDQFHEKVTNPFFVLQLVYVWGPGDNRGAENWSLSRDATFKVN